VDGDGDFLDDDLGDLSEEMRHLGRSDDLGFVSSVSFGAGAFEDPGGGSPVFGFAAGAVEVFEVNDFGWFRRGRGDVAGECSSLVVETVFGGFGYPP
jgi:hypothetical protein